MSTPASTASKKPTCPRGGCSPSSQRAFGSKRAMQVSRPVPVAAPAGTPGQRDPSRTTRSHPPRGPCPPSSTWRASGSNKCRSHGRPDPPPGNEGPSRGTGAGSRGPIDPLIDEGVVEPEPQDRGNGQHGVTVGARKPLRLWNPLEPRPRMNPMLHPTRRKRKGSGSFQASPAGTPDGPFCEHRAAR